MINWTSVFFNSFWILGLAILLAAFSYHHWLAGQVNRRLSQQLNQPSFLLYFWVALIFIGVGLAGTSQRVWETAVWSLFVLMSLLNVVKIGRYRKPQ